MTTGSKICFAESLAETPSNNFIAKLSNSFDRQHYPPPPPHNRKSKGIICKCNNTARHFVFDTLL
ncbi:MAG: hypothetical protein LBC87_05755 [Fibromonadaceae bacterium]|nr:hypothetical protein [Fibromonadaceae bacterium]